MRAAVLEKWRVKECMPLNITHNLKLEDLLLDVGDLKVSDLVLFALPHQNHDDMLVHTLSGMLAPVYLILLPLSLLQQFLFSKKE